MVQKMYESYKINFGDLVRLSGRTFSVDAYADTEAVILGGLGFEIPGIDPDWGEGDILKEISRI